MEGEMHLQVSDIDVLKLTFCFASTLILMFRTAFDPPL